MRPVRDDEGVELERLAVAADFNLAAAWTALGRHAGFAVSQNGPVTMAASGLPVAFFNSAFVASATTDPAQTISDVQAFFGPRGVPFLLWVRSGLDDALLAAGRDAGLVDAGGPPLMIMSTITDSPPPPAGMEITLARDDGDLSDHRALLSAGFSMPLEVAHTLIGSTCVDDPNLAVAVGRVDGVPVATALLARSGETAGVYNVATAPEHQRKGYGAAVTWAAVAEGARRGCTHSVLQASEAGYPVYRRMGFAEGGRYVQLMGPPAS